MNLRIPLVLLAALSAPLHALPAAQPNIIFILTDDLGYGDLGSFYQNSRNFAVNRDKPAFATPQLDGMAAEGVRLTHHYCGAPVCAPSRASLLLGVTQGHANVRDNQFDKALEDNHTLASVMRGAGYATAIIGKWGLQGGGAIPVAHPQYRGFDDFYGYMTHLNGHHHYPKESGNEVWDGLAKANLADLDKCYTTDLWTARTKKWISEHEAASPAQPFFLYLAYDSPHAQLQVPTSAYPAGGGTGGGMQWLGTPGRMITSATGTVDSYIFPDYANATYDHDGNPATPEIAWPEYAKRHATMVRRLDDSVADIIQTLKDLNIDNDTLVVFTSDNGPHNEAGSGGTYTQDPRFFNSFGNLDGIKRDTLEGGFRVPAIVRWPGHIPAGSVRADASQFHDWMATFAELAGVPAPARCDGASLLPTLTGTGSRAPSTIYTEYSVSGSTPNYTDFLPAHRNQSRNQQQVLWLGDYKGIRVNTLSQNGTPFKIYNIPADPQEATDLTGQAGVPAQQDFRDAVLQLRRANSSAARPYDGDPVPALALNPNQPGVTWRAFEKSLPWVPDFTGITPAAAGTTTTPSVSIRTRDNDIGLEFSGYLKVPTDGDYTFYLTADTGAFLRLHEIQVLDADFGYTGGTEISSTLKLKAGLHPYSLGYRHGTAGSPALALSWSGPALAKQPVPSTAFFVNGVPVSAQPARWKLEEGSGTTTTEEASGTLSDAFGAGISWSAATPGSGSAASLLFPGTAAGKFGVNRSAADVGIGGGGAKTLTGWIRSTHVGSVQMFFGWSPSNGGGPGQDLRLGLDGGGHLRLEVSSGFALAETVALNDGQWHQTGVVIEPGDTTATVQFYIDGMLTDPTSSAVRAIATSATGNAPNDEIVFGAGYASGTQPWDGQLDDVRVFPEALGKPALDALRTEMTFVPPPTRWKLDEGTGNTTKESVSSVVSDPFVSGISWSANVPGPASAASLSFTGTAGVGMNLDSAATGISGNGAKTLSAWIKTGATADIAFFGYSPTNGATAGADIRLLVNAAGKLRFEANAGNFAISANSVNDNAWHFVALVIPAGATPAGVSFYTDGVLSAPASSGSTAVISTATGLEILLGTDGNAGRHFSGLLDDVRVASKALAKPALDAIRAEMAVAPAGYNSWIGGYFPGASDPATIGPAADPDGDGANNATEFLLGGNPALPGDSGKITTRTELGNLILSFLRADQAIGALGVYVQLGDDLMTWSAASEIVIGADTASSGAGVVITDQGTSDLVEISIPMTPGLRRFARLRLTLP